MAHNTVTHTCNHQQTHQLYGKSSERERKIAWLETTLCTDCWKKEHNEARALQNEQSKEVNATAALVALTGSEKQIAWAETIRATTRTYLLAGEQCIRDKLDLPEPARSEVSDGIVLVIEEVLGHSESKWWIDNREDNTHIGLHNARGYWIDKNPSLTASWIATEIVARGLAPSYNRLLEEKKQQQEVSRG